MGCSLGGPPLTVDPFPYSQVPGPHIAAQAPFKALTGPPRQPDLPLPRPQEPLLTVPTTTSTQTSSPVTVSHHPWRPPCSLLALLKRLLPPPLLSHLLRPSSDLSSSVTLPLAVQPKALSVSAGPPHHLLWTFSRGQTATIAFSINWQWPIPSHVPLGEAQLWWSLGPCRSPTAHAVI